ncbi:MAG: DUF2723 domain-containing protein [Myxococcota bacterium]
MQWVVRLFWLLPLGFYGATASPTPGWVDAPLIARTVYLLDLSTWVNHHNLFTLVGHAWLRLTPGLDPHFALNLLAALFGALTVGVVFRIGLRLTRNVIASAIGATLLMVSHSLWWHSTMLEVYTLSTLLLTLCLLFVVRFNQEASFRNLCIAVFLFGLACSNHIQMGLVGFGFPVLLLQAPVREALSGKRLVALLACFLLGFQVYLWVFVSQYLALVDAGTDATTALHWMLENTTGGGFRQYMFPQGLSIEERAFWWAFYFGLFIYNFPLPWLLLAPLGLWAWWKREELRTSFLFFTPVLVVQLLWSSNYLIWDMFAFSLPAYVLTGLLILLGIDRMMRRGTRARRTIYALAPTILLIPVLYGAVPSWVADNKHAIRFFEKIPQYAQVTAFWDPLEYFLNPNKRGYDRVDRYAEAILTKLKPDACFWGNEATMFYPLKYYYQDVLGERKDVSYHAIFGILGDPADFARHVDTLYDQLRSDCPVYVSSLGYPEREVLNRLYYRLKRTRSRAEIEELPTASFAESFPRYRIEPVPIAGESAKFFRLAR